MDNLLTLGSLFDGSGGFPLGAVFSGILPLWASEIEPSVKPKSRKQIVKWLKSPYSDAAEYRLWGNDVALPCVCFVLREIVESVQTERAEACPV